MREWYKLGQILSRSDVADVNRAGLCNFGFKYIYTDILYSSLFPLTEIGQV